jgi:hypothetical protein
MAKAAFPLPTAAWAMKQTSFLCPSPSLVFFYLAYWGEWTDLTYETQEFGTGT